MTAKSLLLIVALFASSFAFAANYPTPKEGDYLIKNFQFASGENLPELRLHYRTLGEPQRDAQGNVTNAILILHSTGGSSEQFLNDRFAAVLFNPGQLLDSTKYFIIIPDSIGHGKSSKPSDGLHARFPRYRYADMVRAQHQLVTDHLNVQHLRLLMGMSMGCMHAWMWAEDYPRIMDGTIPLACLPAEIAGRNRMWRKTAHDAITLDPDYAGGDYKKQPRGVATAYQILALVGSNPVERQRQYSTGATADKYMDQVAQLTHGEDGNDLAYALDSSLGYDPSPKLSTIQSRLLAINFADDLINPPELGILESAIKEVPKGRAILIPAGPNTHGHGTHTSAEVWKSHLQGFLQQTEMPGVVHVSKSGADVFPYTPDPPYTEAARKASPACSNSKLALQIAEKTGIEAVGLEQNFDLEQLLLDPQLWGVQDKIGTRISSYCVYDVKLSGFQVRHGRIAGEVVHLHGTPVWIICDESCAESFIVSDSDLGIKNFNRLMAKFSKKISNTSEAKDVASLALILIKRVRGEWSRINIIKTHSGYIAKINSNGKAISMIISPDLSVDFRASTK